MAKYSAICPACRKKFPWEPTLGYPESCPLCSFRIASDRDDSDIVMPSIRTLRTKVIDRTYTDMERGSQIRAQAAAEMTGASATEMSGLKITDLNTGMREGDIAAKEDRAAAARLGVTDSTKFFGNGVEYSSLVQSGAHPNMGAHMRKHLQEHHPNMVARHIPGTSTDVVSERDAAETYQPGYRRRA